MTIGMESTENEWPAGLDVAELLTGGWRPVPFQQFILKVHSRCNLACDYCYMYEMADQSWRGRPKVMETATIDLVAGRIAEHAAANGLQELDLVLHGGEPLLAGPERLGYAVTRIRAAVAPGTTVRAVLQTNGTLLDERFLALFDTLDVHVGVSLDGDARANDLHRRDRAGRSSHAAVQAGIRALSAPRYRHLYNGLLTTIDLRNDPVATYEALVRLRPPAIDFLLPHANWETPPPVPVATGSPTPYGDWLVRAFDRWYAAGGRETRVRLFAEIVRLLVGGPSRSEEIGLSPVALLVIETDGGIEQVDSLKSAYEGAAGTPLHVRHDSFDAALVLPAVAARQIGELALSTTCRACDLRQVCGGGNYTHRYRRGTGFANPSVYCADLTRLITHVRTVVRRDLTTLRTTAAARQAVADGGRSRPPHA